MKTMNYLLSIALLFMVGSCSKDTPTENEDLAAVEYRSRTDQNVQEEPQEIFELDLHQYAMVGKLGKLYERKALLEAEIEDGSEYQIPKLEQIMRQIEQNLQTLEDVLTDTCFYLRVQKSILEGQVSQGLRGAKEKLEQIKEKLEQCEKEASEYASSAHETLKLFLYIKEKGPIGGRCNPGEEWTCFDEFEKGILRINIVEAQGGQPEVFLKDANGKVIGQSKSIGKHGELEGVTQIAIELQSVQNGVLEVVSDSGSFEQTINVR